MEELKKNKMKADAYSFFRGSLKLWVENFLKDYEINKSEFCLVCSDLHYENFGSYLADGLVGVFGPNDFDEALYAPYYLDAARLISSVLFALRVYKNLDVLEAEQIAIDLYKHFYINLTTNIGSENKLNEFIRKVEYKKNLPKKISLMKKECENKISKNKLIKKFLDNEKFSESEKIKLIDFEKNKKIDKINEIDGLNLNLKDLAIRLSGLASLSSDRLIAYGKNKFNKNIFIDLKPVQRNPLKEIEKLKSEPLNNQLEEELILSAQKIYCLNNFFITKKINLDNKIYIMRNISPGSIRMNIKNDCNNINLLIENSKYDLDLISIGVIKQFQNDSKRLILSDSLNQFNINLMSKNTIDSVQYIIDMYKAF